jgi:hypothetical protein
MSEPVDPLRRVPAPRRWGRGRRETDNEGEEGAPPETSRALVPVDPAPHADDPPPVEPSPAEFAAQLLGQGERKRGLKGGPEVLETARESYLKTEYSGPADRRPKPGRVTKTEI